MSAHYKSRWSLMPKGVSRKIMAAFCLMSIIPLLVIVFLATTYIFPTLQSSAGVLSQSIVLILATLISLMGLLLTKRIVDPIVKMAFEARRIASGDVEKVIEVQSDDEVGDLAVSMNEMADRIKKNMSELTSYGERIETINYDINKKVTALSSVLQITTLMSQSVQLDVVLDLVMSKISQVTAATQGILFTRKSGDIFVPRVWRGTDTTTEFELDTQPFREMIVRLERMRKLVVWDAQERKELLAEELLKKLDLASGVIVPIVFQKKLHGFLIMGSIYADSVFSPQDIEVIHIFQKQIVIALENHFLVKRNKELAVRDEATGLYNERFIRERLSEEIRRAILFQRPCAYTHFSINHFNEYERQNSPVAAQTLLKKVGQVILDHIDDISKAGRSGKGDFAVILPEKNRGEALQLAELIRAKIEALKVPGDRAFPGQRLTLNVGVSANPIDGLTGDELINKALVSLLKAKRAGSNKETA